MTRTTIEDLTAERTVDNEGELNIVGAGHGCDIGYGVGHYDACYTPRVPVFHDTSHFDYVPGGFVPHGNHFHYVPGQYRLHRTGHYHF